MKNEKNFKEISVTRQSEPIAVSTDRLWEIIGPGFADVGKWATSIDYSEGSGNSSIDGAPCDERACDISAKGFDKVGEKITKYDATNQKVSYRVLHGMPGFVKFAENNWEVVKVGDKSALKMNLTMQLGKFMGAIMGGMFNRSLQKTFTGMFEDIKVYAETGDVSKAKKERMAKLQQKEAA